MTFSISIRTCFAIIAYITCFLTSYFLLWDDQMKLSNFHINPHQSVVTRFLVKHSVYDMKDIARIFGTVLAFASIHLSWGYRYFVGDFLLNYYQRNHQNNSPNSQLDQKSIETKTKTIQKK